MRRFQKIIVAGIFSFFLLGNNIDTKAQIDNYDYYDDNYGASYQDFYDGLSPYGQWINDPQYGYVWLPDVGPDFRPYYTNGYWAMTQYGNTWVSNYDWGWATFHYGRWTFDNYYGWLWLPDTQWAPAWVSWRSNNSYYGWAPMGPGVGINVSLGLIPTDWWVFLSPNYFYEPRFQRYCNNDWAFNRNIYSQTTYINYTYNNNRNSYYTGPRADDYRRRTGRQTSMFNIENNNRRGSSRVNGNNINMYRPSMRNSSNAAPRKIVAVERSITQRPQAYNNAQPVGRQWVLNQTATNNTPTDRNTNRVNNNTVQPINNTTNRQREIRVNTQQIDEKNVQNQREQNAQIQQRNEQINRQNIEQQRAQQQEQTRQQQIQQRDELQNRQRAMQAEEANRQRMQQQRDAQINQQRNDEQNRQKAIQAEEANRQRIQQQRDAQINQQREQENSRIRQQQQYQIEQQRNVQQQQRIQEAAPQAPREQRTREARPMINNDVQRSNVAPSAPSYSAPQRSEGGGIRRR